MSVPIVPRQRQPTAEHRRQDTVPGVCWRCGEEFAQTTDEALRKCAELAREAA